MNLPSSFLYASSVFFRFCQKILLLLLQVRPFFALAPSATFLSCFAYGVANKVYATRFFASNLVVSYPFFELTVGLLLSLLIMSYFPLRSFTTILS